MTNLSHIKIILVEPAGALNIGSVARSMKNMGLNQLCLVNPHCDYQGEDARKMAVHAINILEDIQCFKSLPDALKGCHKAIATTARNRSIPLKIETPQQALPWLLEDQKPVALIFGAEDRGLNNQELSYAQRFVTIPTHSEYSSLNLAQAVTVCVYELYQLSLNHQNPNDNFPVETLANFETLEGYYQNLETFLLEIGYLLPHTTQAKMQKFRRLFNRSYLTSDEVAMLRGILRQAQWAIKKSNN